MNIAQAILGRFRLGKGIMKASHAAAVAGVATVGATGGEVPESAIVTVAVWLVKLLIDWIRHR